MSMKRYDLVDDGQVSLGIGEHPTGNYTLHTDYAALEQENERLKKRVRKLEAALSDCMGYVNIDNLTMQQKEREWQQILDEGGG